MPALLHASSISKSFESKVAVESFSIEIQRGETVSIIGPNGAGKTTTLLMLLGAIEPDTGTIEIDGFSLPKDRHAAMASVGFAAGYLPLPDRLRVGETLEFFADLYGVADPEEAIDSVASSLHIQHLLSENCETLSSGQSTLVGIARAILHSPPLVILDEPTASLDPDVALRVRDKLASLCANQGLTLLLTSHDMREVESLSSRVVFLRDGNIVADGSPSDIVADAGHESLEDMFLAEAQRHREELL